MIIALFIYIAQGMLHIYLIDFQTSIDKSNATPYVEMVYDSDDTFVFINNLNASMHN